MRVVLISLAAYLGVLLVLLPALVLLGRGATLGDRIGRRAFRTRRSNGGTT